MGDHRATIKITFEIHGKIYKQEWWINYWPDDSTGVDNRIAQWFSECWDDALCRYRQAEYDRDRVRIENEEETRERAELARLKEKYEAQRIER